jgi:hypothetical protein
MTPVQKTKKPQEHTSHSCARCGQGATYFEGAVEVFAGVFAVEGAAAGLVDFLLFLLFLFVFTAGLTGAVEPWAG